MHSANFQNYSNVKPNTASGLINAMNAKVNPAFGLSVCVLLCGFKLNPNRSNLLILDKVHSHGHTVNLQPHQISLVALYAIRGQVDRFPDIR